MIVVKARVDHCYYDRVTLRYVPRRLSIDCLQSPKVSKRLAPGARGAVVRVVRHHLRAHDCIQFRILDFGLRAQCGDRLFQFFAALFVSRGELHNLTQRSEFRFCEWPVAVPYAESCKEVIQARVRDSEMPSCCLQSPAGIDCIPLVAKFDENLPGYKVFPTFVWCGRGCAVVADDCSRRLGC